MIQLHSLHVVINFLGFWSLFAFCGLLITRFWLIPPEAFALPELDARWRRMLLECLSLMAIAGVMLLLVRTGEMDEGTLPRVMSDLPQVLTQTHFGRIWLLHLLTLGLLWPGCTLFIATAPSGKWAACMAGGVLVLAFTYSASSHASDSGDFTLAELNDWVHIVSTSLWGGGIFASALLIFPVLRGRHEMLVAVAFRLSALSGAALVLVLLTGLYNSLRQLPGWGALLDTNYGRMLSVKMAVVAMLMLIGAWNRFVLVPRLGASGNAPAGSRPSRLLFRMLVIDAVLLLLALVMAALLVQNEAR